MSIGQAAGHAASQSIHDACSVQSVDVLKLQRTLHADHLATIYVSDVLPGTPDFAAVQWWGTLGGFHRLEPMPSKPGKRGDNIHGQYSQANPGHAANLDLPLTDEVRDRWNALLPPGVHVPKNITTRGDWVRTAHHLNFKDRK